MPRWIEGTVVENIHWTDTLYSIRVCADIGPFTPGQYIRLGLAMGDKPIMRPYSFVNTPDDEICEFYSIVVPEGPLSPRLYALEAGDRILISRKSGGFFTLAMVPDADTLWMLSTGTGLGPFLSMLKTDEPWQKFDNLVLIHAVRRIEELSYQKQIRSFIEHDDNRFQYIPFVSRQQSNFALPGRIPASIASGALQQRAGLPMTTQDSQVMICGNPAMIQDTMALLETQGFMPNTRRQRGHVTTEIYWQPNQSGATE